MNAPDTVFCTRIRMDDAPDGTAMTTTGEDIPATSGEASPVVMVTPAESSQ